MLSGQGSTLFSAINGMIGVLGAIQLWLVSAAMTALYENEPEAVEPTFIASVLIALFNAFLLRHALTFDKRRRQDWIHRQRGPGFTENDK
jgi:putative flippase GtrA